MHCLFLSHQREINIVGKVKCLSPALPLLVMLTPLYRSVFVPMTVRSNGSLLLRISALISNAGREGVTRESSLHLTSSLPYLAHEEQLINLINNRGGSKDFDSARERVRALET